MSDSDLQQFKRAWSASGSREDEATYLRERVRVGQLTPHRLKVAAWCGHAAAQLALGQEPRAQELSELGQFGIEWLVRAYGVLLTDVAERQSARLDEDTRSLLEQALALAPACVTDVGPERLAELGQLGADAEAQLFEVGGVPPWSVPPGGAPGARVAHAVCLAIMAHAQSLFIAHRSAPDGGGWTPKEGQARASRFGCDALGYLLQVSELGTAGLRSELAQQALTPPL